MFLEGNKMKRIKVSKIGNLSLKLKRKVIFAIL